MVFGCEMEKTDSGDQWLHDGTTPPRRGAVEMHIKSLTTEVTPLLPYPAFKGRG